MGMRGVSHMLSKGAGFFLLQTVGVSLDEPPCPITSLSFCFCVKGSAGGQWAPG